MANLWITAEMEPQRAVNEPRALWVGSDAPIRARIAREPTNETAVLTTADLLTRSEISSAKYAVYREVDDADALVADYEEVTIDLATAVPDDGDLPTAWAKDGVGHNLRFKVPYQAFAANALHTVVLTVVVDGERECIPLKIQVDGPRGDIAPVGGGTSGGGETGGDPPSLWSATEIVEVSATSTETTLLGDGEGTTLIAADDWGVGDVLVGELAGDWTQTGTASDVTLAIKAGGVTLANLPIAPLNGLSNERWRVSLRIARLTTGATGTVLVEGWLWADNTDAEGRPFGSTAAVTLPSDASQQLDLTADWVTGHANNKWRLLPPSEFYWRRAS